MKSSQPAVGVSSDLVSLVIPAYNEERRLPASLMELREFCAHWDNTEVIIADDGSVDGTAEVAREASVGWPAVRLLRLEHRGKGAAVRAGILAAKGGYRIIADADLSMPCSLLPSLVERLRAGADVVVGSREGSGAVRMGEPRLRHLMGRAFNLAARAMALTDLPDTQCGFKAFTAFAATALFTRQRLDGFAFDVEILYIARRLGFRVCVLPIEWHYDPDSRVRPGTDSIRMFRDVLALRLATVAGRYDRRAAGPGLAVPARQR